MIAMNCVMLYQDSRTFPGTVLLYSYYYGALGIAAFVSVRISGLIRKHKLQSLCLISDLSDTDPLFRIDPASLLSTFV